MSLPVIKNSGPWTLESLAETVSEIVAKESGNVLGPGQQSMVASRLRKRLMDLGGLSPQAYYKHLMSHYKNESLQLVSMLTTHHTFFFREFSHFEFALSRLDEVVARAKARGENKIKVLSAACSRGQEVYSLGMFLSRHLSAYPGMSFEILGTDIDPESVKIGQNGVYPYKEVKSIPQIYLQGNWQRGRGEISDFAKIKNTVKDKCSFKVMNLLKIQDVLGREKYDMIFCRNVFIYFKSPDIAKIVDGLKKHLFDGGFLFTGLSESLKEIGPKDMNTHAPSVYSFGHLEEKPSPKQSHSAAVAPQPKPVAVVPSPVRVLVVDDSPSVVKLLSKIFESDPEFELAGSAKNGLEAKEFLKNNKVDAMTLDIHMPEMDGVEYLKNNFGAGHPKVVVVSSASREDTRYAQETLRHGACDFVEKPALNNLGKRAEEIKNKIKMAFFNDSSGSRGPAEIDKSFRKDFSISRPEERARVFFANFSDLKKVKSALGELKGTQPPVYLFFEGNGNYLDMIKSELGLWNSEVFEGQGEKNGQVYICDFESHMEPVKEILKKKTSSFAVFGICSGAVFNEVAELSPGQLLLEDLPGLNEDMKELASDVFPWTSFAHVGTEFLAKE